MTKTYAQLAREIAALQASAQKQLALEAKGAIAKINDMISKYSLTADDLKFTSTSASAVSPLASKKTKVTKGKSGTAAKGARFSDGKGNQWGGRGPRPAWLRNAIAAGRTLESFAVGAPPVPAPDTVASVAPSPAKTVAEESIAPKRIKSAASAKGKSKEMALAAKPSADAAVAAPTGAAKTPVKTARKKVAAKVPVAAAAGAPPAQVIQSPVKRSPATKGGTTKAAGASKAVKKSTGPKKAAAGSTPALTAKKAAAAKKAVPGRKKAGSPSAARKAAVAKRPAPAAPEAAAAAVAP
jgi:DNA-binding protein H-NS